MIGIHFHLSAKSTNVGPKRRIWSEYRRDILFPSKENGRIFKTYNLDRNWIFYFVEWEVGEQLSIWRIWNIFRNSRRFLCWASMITLEWEQVTHAWFGTGILLMDRIISRSYDHIYLVRKVSRERKHCTEAKWKSISPKHRSNLKGTRYFFYYYVSGIVSISRS